MKSFCLKLLFYSVVFISIESSFAKTESKNEKHKVLTHHKEIEFLSQTHQLTLAGTRTGEGYYRQDGSLMVYQSEREKSNPFYQIYLMNLTTGSSNLISTGVGKTTCPWIHPKEQKVLFSSTHLDPQVIEKQKTELEFRASGKSRRYSWDYDENFDLFTTDFSGKNISRLTNVKGYDAEASFSPDGDWIVFASNRTGYELEKGSEDEKRFAIDPSYEMELYTMRSNGSELKRLTFTKGYDGGPFFSPDGNKIIWRRFTPDGRSADIYIMNRDGSDQNRLTFFNSISWAPYFHPTGDYFLFSSNLGGGHNFEVYLMRVDGLGPVVKVTDHPGFDGLPVFHPNGHEISWAASRAPDGKAQIFRAKWNDERAREILDLNKHNLEIPISYYSPEILKEELMSHVQVLSSEKMKGRMTGTEGELLAKDYIQNQLEYLKLDKLDGTDSFLFPFEFFQNVKLGKNNKFSNINNLNLQVEKDWIPLSDSKIGEFKIDEIIFAGYGIKLPKTLDFGGYDSYEGVHVNDKWVLVLEGEPNTQNSAERQYFARSSSNKSKSIIAKDLGAKGIIILKNNKELLFQSTQFNENQMSASLEIPSIIVSELGLAKILNKPLNEIKKIKKTLNSNKANELVFSLENPWSVNVDLAKKPQQGVNVVGKISGESKDAIVIGAHFDHLGLGVNKSRKTKTKKQQIHFGADDNASGVSILLELAAKFKQISKSKKLDRDLIFAFWSGEELGTLGSSSFVKDFVHTNKVKPTAYLNLDMVGRLGEKLVVQGIGSSSDWMEVLEKRGTPMQLPMSLQLDPFLPTDTTPFYISKIPVLNFFTGAHSEYHSPADTFETLNYDGMEVISKLVFGIVDELVSRKSNLQFNEFEKINNQRENKKLKIYLGTIPDYTDDRGLGLPINGTKKGGPAEKAGIQSGDLIVELGGIKVENIYDYTNALEKLIVGKKAIVKVKRNKKLLSLSLIPEAK